MKDVWCKCIHSSVCGGENCLLKKKKKKVKKGRELNEEP